MSVGDIAERNFGKYFSDLNRVKISVDCYLGPDMFVWVRRSGLTKDRPDFLLGVYDEVTETFVCTNTEREDVFLKSIGEVIFGMPLWRVSNPSPVIINYARGLGTQATKMMLYFVIQVVRRG
ncbi:MAG: hypothetical protein LBS68_02400 [Puniceicoccales bacterium]|jgi:hypothetical protein|nr:hypothetical protein [Puniceicoccales bacterium]